MGATHRELQLVSSPMSPALRRQYEQEIGDLELRIAELEARRRDGDLSEETRRQLHALVAKQRSVEDRIDRVKRRSYNPEIHTPIR